MTEIEKFEKLHLLYLNNKDKLNKLTKISSNGGIFKLIPRFISKSSEDEYHCNLFKKNIEELGYSNQIYYDIFILNISKISDRPKCKCSSCNNKVKFINFTKGYQDYCSIKCKSKEVIKTNYSFLNSQIGVKQSYETKKKRNEKLKGNTNKPGYKHTEEAKLSMSRNRKGKKHSKEWIRNLSKAALNRIDKNPENALSNLKFGNSKKGWYKPEKSDNKIRYMSSWELHFIKICDNCKDVISMNNVPSIKYYEDDNEHRYVPDFLLTVSNGEKLLVEIKPYNLIYKYRNLLKRIAAKKYCMSNYIKFAVITEEELFKRNRDWNIFDYII